MQNLDPEYPTVLEAQGLVVDYIVSSHRYTSLKEYALAAMSGKLVKAKTFTALTDVSFQLRKGETLGLIGRNGSGKSTLLKACAGIIKPKDGAVTRHGTLTSLIELGAGFDGELTAEENIYLSCMLMGFDKKLIKENVEKIFEFSELKDFRSFPVKTFSSGMYARLGFACATLIEADIILIDEVLAVGDEAFQLKCLHHMQKLKSSGRSIIFVSHDLGTVQTFCDRVCVLDHGNVIFAGDPATGVEKLRSLLLPDQHRDSLRDLSSQLKISVYTPEDLSETNAEVIIETEKDLALQKFDWKIQIFGFGQSKPLMLIGASELEVLRLKGLAVVETKAQLEHMTIKFRRFPFHPGEFMIFLTIQDSNGEIGHVARGLRFNPKKLGDHEERGIFDITTFCHAATN